MTEMQTRTLDLGEGRRTTVKFDPVTWRAIELMAAREGIRWTQWVRKLMAVHPGAENMHATIRAAAIEGLLAEQVLAERAEQAMSVGRAVLLEGCVTLTDDELREELAAGHIEGEPLEMVAFQLMAGLDQHNQPTIWLRNGLRDGMNLAITLPFSADEVANKRGAFA